MRVALVGPEIEENLGLRYIQAALQAEGHEVELLPFNRGSELLRVLRGIRRGDPGLVGFSLVAQCRFEDFSTLAARLRSSGFRGHITAGGHFASLRAAEILEAVPGIDTILHHDGEERIVRLAAWIEGAGPVSGEPGAAGTGPAPPSIASSGSRRGMARADPPEELDGITWRAHGGGALRHRPPRHVPDLGTLGPPFRRRPHRTLTHARAPLVASRGCSGSCSFCSIHAWHAQVPASRRLRFREPERVAEEMIALHRDRGVDVFVFHDDDFLPRDRDHAFARCRAIFETAERGIGRPFAFVIKCRPDDVGRELFAYLKAKGLVRAYVGIETHSRLGLATLHRRLDPGTNLRALATLRELGVFACFNLLLFHPDSTMEELEENLCFLGAQLDLPFDVARTELYARSPLETRMLREGRALGDFRGYDYRIADPRVEVLFRLFATALWERHFGGSSILHRAQDLGYRASLLRRLHPRLFARELQGRVDRLIRDVNADTLAHIRGLLDFAAERGFRADCLRDPDLARIQQEIGERVRIRRDAWRALSLELELRARIDRSPLARAAAARAAPDWLGRAAAAFPLLAAALGAFSCGEEGRVCDPPPPPTRYSRDVEPLVVQTCATPDCHTGASPQAGLDLSAGVGRGSMVDVPSSELPGMDRVEPGIPDSSYVMHKLRGTQLTVGGQGERMPKGQPPAEELTDRMRWWIYEGAKDD